MSERWYSALLLEGCYRFLPENGVRGASSLPAALMHWSCSDVRLLALSHYLRFPVLPPAAHMGSSMPSHPRDRLYQSAVKDAPEQSRRHVFVCGAGALENSTWELHW